MILPGRDIEEAVAASPEPVVLTRKGRGNHRYLLVPGLVPDGPETFERQMKLLLSKGDVRVASYPREAFDLERVFGVIEDFLRECDAEKQKPVLFGVSVGGAFVLEFLRRAREQGRAIPLSGLVLVSPLTCPDDLAPILRRLWNPIVADEGQPQAALEKGRSFFKSLVARSGGARLPKGWKGILAALTPQGLADISEAALRKRIEATLAGISAHGAIERCRALCQLPGLDAGSHARKPLCTVPTLILWGSRERHTIDIDGPGARVLCRPDLAGRHFPSCEVHWLYGKGGEEVPHASLLKHHKAFSRPLRKFLERI